MFHHDGGSLLCFVLMVLSVLRGEWGPNPAPPSATTESLWDVQGMEDCHVSVARYPRQGRAVSVVWCEEDGDARVLFSTVRDY